MNKQKMTRTTELLKGCGTSDAVPYEDDYVCCGHDNGHWEEQEYQDGDHTHKEDIWVKQILLCKTCKSQLKGRLDALKEEETKSNNRIDRLMKFAEVLVRECGFKMCIQEKYKEDKPFKAIVTDFQLMLEEEKANLASIQEEIKLIEGAI